MNTASMAAWAHFSPSALDTPIEPITSPSIMIGKAPGCGKSCMKVGARFWPLRTTLFISEVGRRQRSARPVGWSALVGLVIAILHPLKDVAEHIVEAEGVGRE